jgi:hypothetical protein
VLIVEENLLSGSEDKIGTAVYALQLFVLEFHGIDPLSAPVPQHRNATSPGSRIAYTE